MILDSFIKRCFIVILIIIFSSIIISGCSRANQPKQSKEFEYPPARDNVFYSEKIGVEPTTLIPIVGFWQINTDDNIKVLMVDGSKWNQGTASKDITNKARILFGENYAQFANNVKSNANFPFAVSKNIQDFRQGEITIRFKSIAGREDQVAGIIFNIRPNGDYLILRVNALEDNMVLFNYEGGIRSEIKSTGGVPTKTGKWHEFKLIVLDTKLEGYLDGNRYMEYTLPSPVSGKVGIWSKSDSVVNFGDFKVTEK